MIEENILVPISAAAYKHDNAEWYGAMELDVKNNQVAWNFNPLKHGYNIPQMINDEEGITRHYGFRPSSVQRLDGGTTLLAGWRRFLILDKDGTLLEDVSHKQFNDVHEVKYTSHNTYLVAATGSDKIIEMDEMFNVIWEWDMWEHVDEDLRPGNYYPDDAEGDMRDYAFSPDNRFHLNHCQYISDTEILASALNYGLMLIDRDTGGVISKMTGLDECHNPYFQDDSVVVAESGKDRVVEIDKTGETRVMFNEGLDFVKDADLISDDRWLITDTKNNRVLIWVDGEDSPESVINLPEDSVPYEADYVIRGE